MKKSIIKVEFYKVYGTEETFEWEFNSDYDNTPYLFFIEVSSLIPSSEEFIFTSSNGVKIRKFENAEIRENEIDLPDQNFDNTCYYQNQMSSKKIYQALLEFHEFCTKSFLSKTV